MKKILTVFLALALAASLFSCGHPIEGGSESESHSSPPIVSESPVESLPIPEETKPELDLSMDISDDEITIVHWDEAKFNEFYVDEEDIGGNAVNAAVYERNRKVEELLGVSLNFEYMSIISSTIGDFNMWFDRLQNMMDYPPNEVDLFAVYSRAMATSTIRGLNKDMSALNNLDLSKDWWPTYMKESSSVGGKIYYLTGEISPNSVATMYTVFYNKDLLESENIADPAALVEGKEWTVDKLVELSSGIYEDLDGVDGKSEADRFGLTFSWYSAEILVKGAGFTIAEGGDAETPITLSSDLDSTEFSDFINMLSQLCKTNDVYNDPTYMGYSSDAFVDGRAAFWVNVVSNAEYAINEGVSIGFLPMPLLDSTRENYVTPLAYNYSNYAIARACDDDESAAAVLTALAYYGQNLVTPEVYELYFGDADDGAAEIFDLLLETMRSDVDMVFSSEMMKVNDEPSIAIRDGKTLEEEFTDFDKKAVVKAINVLNDKLAALNS